MKCEICGREFKNAQALGCHLSKSKELPIQEYYDKYILKDLNEKCCKICGVPVTFRNLAQGYASYCSTTCLNKAPGRQEKCREGVVKKYGVENVFQLKEIQDKSKAKMKELYGVEHNSYMESTKEKRRDTWAKNYGEECTSPFAIKEIQEKSKKTNLEKYGFEYAIQSDEIREKREKTNIEKYGVDNVFKLPEVQEKIREKQKENFFNKLVSSSRLNDNYIPLFPIEEYNGVEDGKQYKWKCKKCGSEFYDHLDDGRMPRCVVCFPKWAWRESKGENEVFEFCSTYFPIIIKNDRSLLKDRELDIYIPEKKIAIEFNGLYWHSELNGKDKNYHIDKTRRCEELGISLIHIFEDEWINKQEIIKSMLRSRFGKTENKIYARDCVIEEVDKSVADSFYFDNHSQGENINGYSFALKYNNEIVAMITSGTPRFTDDADMEILRFCNRINTSVIGGLSKLFKHITDKFLDIKKIISYSDLRFGKGLGYINCGFKHIKDSTPNYYYIKSEDYFNRISRIKFQKHKLNNLLESFDNDLTEWQNMQLNGYDRIWDCGNSVYIWEK